MPLLERIEDPQLEPALYLVVLTLADV